MDERAGPPDRGVRAARAQRAAVRDLVAGDHGEGRGDHGEALHGNLLYQATMRVPLVLAGAGRRRRRARRRRSASRQVSTPSWIGPASTRPDSLRGPGRSRARRSHAAVSRVRLAAAGRWRSTGTLQGDPARAGSSSTTSPPIRARRATSRGPREPPRAARAWRLSGAVAGGTRGTGAPLGADDAPPAREPRLHRRRRRAGGRARMRRGPPTWRALFDLSTARRGLFVAGATTGKRIPLLERILADDPGNLMSRLRLAAAQSCSASSRARSRPSRARARSSRASIDVRIYLALHHARGRGRRRAAPLSRSRSPRSPNAWRRSRRWPTIRERQGRIADARGARERAARCRSRRRRESGRARPAAHGDGADRAGDRGVRARARLEPGGVPARLELGVLYLAARRSEARAALDRVPRASGAARWRCSSGPR